MKRMTALILSLMLLCALCACGGAPAPAQTAEEPAQTAEEPAAQPAEPETPEAPEVPDTPDIASIVEEVRAMQGEPVQALIDRFGEPVTKEYSSSCLVDGGQDGQWTYDGFTVYTLVQPDGTETVYDCE